MRCCWSIWRAPAVARRLTRPRFRRTVRPCPTTSPTLSALLDRLAGLLGPRGILTDPADLAPHLSDWRALYRGRTPAVVRPASTAELA